MTKTHYYRAYGYQFSSAFELPFLAGSSSDRRDFEIHYERQAVKKVAANENYRQLLRHDTGWTLRYVNEEHGCADYRYSNADARLTVATSLPWEDCAYALVGVVFGAMLADQKITMLHGAAVDVGGQAIVCLGDSGHGKSTLAAGFIARGATLLSDDLVRLSWDLDSPLVEAGSPQLSLMTDAFGPLKDLGLDKTVSGQRPDIDKYILDARGTRVRANLAAILILEKPDASKSHTVVEKQSATQSVLALMHNRYGRHWLETDSVADLDIFAELVKTTPVFLVTRPPGFDELMKSCSTIEKRVGAII